MVSSIVSRFNLKDKEIVTVYFNASKREASISSSISNIVKICKDMNVKNTILLAIGRRIISKEIELQNLLKVHNDIIEDGEASLESSNEADCLRLLTQDWESYAVNRIYLVFDVVY
jgi:hypothetical protein